MRELEILWGSHLDVPQTVAAGHRLVLKSQLRCLAALPG